MSETAGAACAMLLLLLLLCICLVNICLVNNAPDKLHVLQCLSCQHCLRPACLCQLRLVRVALQEKAGKTPHESSTPLQDARSKERHHLLPEQTSFLWCNIQPALQLRDTQCRGSTLQASVPCLLLQQATAVWRLLTWIRLCSFQVLCPCLTNTNTLGSDTCGALIACRNSSARAWFKPSQVLALGPRPCPCKCLLLFE